MVDTTAPAPTVDIWATSWSNLVRHWSAGVVKEIPLACREMTSVAADARGGVMVTCQDAYPDVASYRVTDTGAAPFSPNVRPGTPVAVSPDGTQLIVYRQGTCPSPAPVCDYRFTLRDIASGHERDLLPNGYYLGATLGWTPLGLTYVQPECAEAGCAGIGDRGGTFVWDGTAFARQSPLRFIAAAGAYRVYERGGQSNRADAMVVLSGPNGDIDLTPPGKHERALSVTATGDVLVAASETIDYALIQYGANGSVRWRAQMQTQGARAVGDRFVIAPVYSPVGVPVFHVYDLVRGLRFEIPIGDARVWTASAR